MHDEVNNTHISKNNEKKDDTPTHHTSEAENTNNNNNSRHNNRRSAANSKPNKLADETSPYLLQHAYNPVEWYSWGEEALQRSKNEDKPIFLSIGYSACHWCHVMAHESFEDEETARIMNEHFINIKVDREERPDIDDIYQRVCQLATGTGGWPLSVFLTPNQKPFYVGTYFPKDGRQYNLPGFIVILKQLAEAYKTKRNEVEAATAEFMSALSQTAKDISLGGRDAKPDIERSILDEAAMGLLQMGDTIYGGFGQAPKFPNTSNLLFLLRYYDISGIARFRDFVVFTADKMAQGGINDQLGGGFARYSTDQKWLVPHFEKMLYDNALLAQLYAELYQITKDDRHLNVLKKTLDFVIREMTYREGGFFSAQDADSEGEEGKFYIWSKKEVQDVLAHGKDGQLASDVFCEYYGVTEGGNFELKNILNVRSSTASLAQKYGRPEKEIAKLVEESSAKMLQARDKRVRPGRDEKILTSWNGLMISGFTKGYEVTGDKRYLEAAKEAVKFIESRLVKEDGEEKSSSKLSSSSSSTTTKSKPKENPKRLTTPPESASTGLDKGDNDDKDGRLMRTFKDGESKLNAYLDDYAFYTAGLLDLFSVDSKPEYLSKALRHTNFMLKHFWDNKEENLFFTSDDHEELIVRTKNFYDLAIPSGNSVASLNLIRLYHYTQNDDYLSKAASIMKSGAKQAAENPFGFGQLLMAIYAYVKKPVEIIVVAVESKGSSSNKASRVEERIEQTDQKQQISSWLREQFLPEGITAFVSEKDLPSLQKYPFFKGRSADEGKAETAFVCRNFTCSLPITSTNELARQLGR